MFSATDSLHKLLSPKHLCYSVTASCQSDPWVIASIRPNSIYHERQKKCINLFAFLMYFVARNQTPVKNTSCLFVGLQIERWPLCLTLEFIINAVFPHCNQHFSISPSPFLNKITAINQLWVGGMNDEANISANQAFICLASEEMCNTRRANNYFY